MYCRDAIGAHCGKPPAETTVGFDVERVTLIISHASATGKIQEKYTYKMEQGGMFSGPKINLLKSSFNSLD